MATNSMSYNDQTLGSESTELGQEATAVTSGGGAAAGFRLFSVDYKKNEDLHQMLESNKDSLKLEAMKRIVGMIAKGKNASELFPAVVKNVASKNIELKKLVYVYLVRYAEEQQDLALLSISTFQRALKDPNQLIRASALRVLSSIRVSIIVPIMMLSIKEAASDLSPYVRKTAAHAIQKLYSLDAEQKEPLIEIIEKLLKDKSTLVAGSVVMSFEEVCPERIDLIHKNYRKLCNLLVDVEEWGQVVIINMLTRYARTQFVSPWKEEAMLDEKNVEAFYDSDEDQNKNGVAAKKPYIMDPDHRLLLRNTRPLLQSRNAAVVMGVAQLYWHLAPKSEVNIVAKSLVRLLRSHRKLNVLLPSLLMTKIGGKASCKDGSIGRQVNEVTSKNLTENVVAESVVVIKKLLQTQPSQHSEIIKHMAKLLGNITVPMARASILWLIGEYCERVPKIAPDVLRKVAKSFTTEEEIVKLQILNLGAKLCLTNPKQTKLLMQYILNVAKYDQNYDIRDRTRFIKQLIVPNEKSGALSKYAKKIFLVQKPAPVLESPFKDRDRFQLSTLSHTLNTKANGYLELPEWPETAPDPSVRNVEVIQPIKELVTPLGKLKGKKDNLGGKFYSDSEEQEDSSQGCKSSSESESDSKNEDSSSSSSEESSDSESDKEKRNEESFHLTFECKLLNHKAVNFDAEDEKEENKEVSVKAAAKQEVSLLDLVDFSDVSTPVAVPKPVMASRLAADLEGLSLSSTAAVIDVATPVFVPPKSYTLLHRMSGKGLGAEYHFPRQPCIYNSKMVSVQIILTNNSDKEIRNIRIGEQKLASGMRIHDFYEIECLHPGTSKTASMGIDFCDSTQAANFLLCTCNDHFNVTVQPPVGELLLPVATSEKDFKKEQGKLTGMNENSTAITGSPQNSSSQAIVHKVVNMANVGVVPSGQDNIHRFAAKTVNSGSLVLITIEVKEGSTMQLRINTEKSVIGSVLLRELKSVLSQD
ncbi:AP-3 complex subunit beta-1 [Rhincodon typus]|uniref:AP-3 complex subunit beta-1 n=1 Tax=Rhincodon typus TaxID=259920 RepID=UPI00202E0F04|nr:AP-3 complex subunit beta-1 [Rhincodon typus]